MSANADGQKPSPQQREQALEAIDQALGGLRYGTITVTVHDSKVVQLEVTEKKRFAS